MTKVFHTAPRDMILLGNQGFEKSVAAVETIEKQLGIYELAQFTPPA